MRVIIHLSNPTECITTTLRRVQCDRWTLGDDVVSVRVDCSKRSALVGEAGVGAGVMWAFSELAAQAGSEPPAAL